MALNRIDYPGELQTNVDFMQHSELIETRYLDQTAHPIQFRDGVIPQGVVLQIAGVLYRADSDTAISGTESDYVRITTDGATATADYADDLVGVVWNPQYNGYYDSQSPAQLYLFNEKLAWLNGDVETIRSRYVEVDSVGDAGVPRDLRVGRDVVVEQDVNATRDVNAGQDVNADRDIVATRDFARQGRTGGHSGVGASATSGGGASGLNANTTTGGAVGNNASATASGGAVGQNASVTTGGAVGNNASSTLGGGAVGSNASAAFGGAVGSNASTIQGGAVGLEASATSGGAVGRESNTTTGGAVGAFATAENGGAVGDNATTTSGGAVGNNASATTGGASGAGATTQSGGAAGSNSESTTGGAMGLSASATTGFSGGALAVSGDNEFNLINGLKGKKFSTSNTEGQLYAYLDALPTPTALGGAYGGLTILGMDRISATSVRLFTVSRTGTFSTTNINEGSSTSLPGRVMVLVYPV